MNQSLSSARLMTTHLPIESQTECLSMIDKCDPQEICRLASEAIATSSVQEIRALNVRRERDSLKVSGSVGSFYHKQLALETIRSVSRGMQILNRVDVKHRVDAKH
jgi:hypothetical protein